MVNLLFFPLGKRTLLHDALNQHILPAFFSRRQQSKLFRFLILCGRGLFGSRPQLHIHFLIIDQHRGADRLIALTGDVVQPGGKELAELSDSLFLCRVCGVSLLIHADAAVFIAERPQGSGFRVNLEVHIGVIHPVAILHIVMFHAVMIAVFVVDHQGIIGIPGLQTQGFILAGHDFREQLLKTPEILVGGRVALGRRWNGPWWNRLWYLNRELCIVRDSIGHLAGGKLLGWRVIFMGGFGCSHRWRLRWDRLLIGFSRFIGNGAQNIVIVGLSNLTLGGATHFFHFIRNVIIPNGVWFFRRGYIRVSARFNQSIQQIGKAGPGEVGVAIVKIKGNAVLSTEFCTVQHLTLKLPVAIGREQATDLPAFFRPVVVRNAVCQRRPHRLMEFGGIEIGAGQDMLIVAADFSVGKMMFRLLENKRGAVLCGRLSFVSCVFRRHGMRLFFGQRGTRTTLWSTVSSAISFRLFRWRVRSMMSSVCGSGSCWSICWVRASILSVASSCTRCMISIRLPSIFKVVNRSG